MSFCSEVHFKHDEIPLLLGICGIFFYLFFYILVQFIHLKIP